MSFVQELTWRGLIHQQTDPSLGEKMLAEKLTIYCGFDPTSDSLHVGSLLPMLTLRRAQLAGHRPIAVVGGATGMIGDPSGKSEERKLLSREDIEKNLVGIRAQLDRVLQFSTSGALCVNNGDWFSGLGYLEFLRDIGKHFSVNMMLAKESVRARLEDRTQGISYTEFSYMLVQAYDFLVLFDRENCRLQIGGSDQWGNITAGIDLVRRLRGQEVYGLTMPLITSSSGTKFGKTEKGAVWLDPARTSPYDFFQFFVQTDDHDVVRYLKYFTFLDEQTVEAVARTAAAHPEKREAQRILAREVTRIVHGDEEAKAAEAAATALFGGMSAAAAIGNSAVPSTALPRSILGGEQPVLLVDWLVTTGLCTSKSDARRQIEQRAIYLNDEPISDTNRALGPGDLREGDVMVLRKGKRNHHVLRFA